MSTQPTFFATRTDRRIALAVTIVVALHAALVAFILVSRDAPRPLAVESHTIAATLLPPPQPMAEPAAIQSPPDVPKRVTRTTPAVKPKLAPVAQTPSPQQVEASTPGEPVQTEPTPLALAPAPVQDEPALALNAPKNVPHLDCRIVRPDYPMPSKRRGETGIAQVRFVVGLSGQIEHVELKASSGHPRLDAAALTAMRKSACKPYREKDVTVRAAYTQPFDFSLHD